ncbi:MAG: glycosyltransferase family 2 protein [Anaerolineae bacterium]|nr:glycosyltransferase family 2 protein [Thermoflexales bacterium]MCX7939827.1 glycosyltransferase family 2 protein [Thermoflexales bacterium]MDW8054965.1 glycosyltransferase family 2 protein [Anaerolineae bacterium]MDW8293514.1 glycosyltransferase family 2 protein [Anaerolineae bacterium]
MTRPRYSIIAPVFNEEETLPEFYRRTRAVMDALDGECELILVFDGSRDRSPEIGDQLRAQDSRVKLIKFARNFGHQIAITAGLDYAEGDAVIIIDSDLQDPPEVIPRLVEKWKEGYQVVYAQRAKRAGETPFKLITAALFYRLIRRLSSIDIPPDTGDFRLLDRRVVLVLRQMREHHRFMRGLSVWVGFKQTGILYDRAERFAGRTQYPLRKMVRFALDAITSFSHVPLQLVTTLGFLVSLLALLAIPIIGMLRLVLGFDFLGGQASTLIAVLFMGGVQLISLGILGEYLGRIYDEVKQRPLYVVAEAPPKPPPSDELSC